MAQSTGPQPNKGFALASALSLPMVVSALLALRHMRIAAEQGVICGQMAQQAHCWTCPMALGLGVAMAAALLAGVAEPGSVPATAKTRRR